MADKRYLSSLRRGLAALRVLNVEERIMASELARKIGVPRTAAHRILDTLVAEGYAVHEAHSHRYHLAAEVRGLALGVSGDSPIAEAARPILRELCKTLLTPVGLTTPVDHTVVIQVSLDAEAPLARARLPEGHVFPVTWGPSGHLYLAHCAPDLRRRLIEIAARTDVSEVPTDAYLETIRAQQYAFSLGHNPEGHEGVVAAPVYREGAFVGSVHVRFLKRLLSRDEVVEGYLPAMHAATARLGAALAAGRIPA